jgi:hypothetical protein
MMLKERYFIKVVPQRGTTVHRFEITRPLIVGAMLILAAVVLGSIGFGITQIYRARTQVASLRAQSLAQRAQIQSIDSRASSIRTQLRTVERQNQQIQQLIGVKAKPPAVQKTSFRSMHGRSPVALVARHVEVLAADSAETAAESQTLKHLTMHLLNIRHLEGLARERLLASIPSLDPVDGAPIIGCFCYRTSPDTEFHPGVDLSADYGTAVRASAAGVVASVGWDGGYGIKVDIDHGNGYHTWYAHLSKADVSAGQEVTKGEHIAEVGSTGFSTGPHLHYQVMLNNTPVDPTPYLNGVPAKVLADLP